MKKLMSWVKTFSNNISKTNHIKKIFLFFLAISSIASGQTTVNPNLNYGFTGRGPIPWNASVNVLTSSKIIATDVHVYFIGATDNKIYDIAWDGTSWHGYNAPLVGNQVPVLSGTQLINDMNVLYFVGTDLFIYELKFVTGTGWISTKLVPSQNKVRPGTDIIFKNGHIYYVNLNNKICDIIFGGVWQGGAQLSSGQTVNVKNNTQILATDIHVYFIGTDDKIYDIVWDQSAGWINGGWPLDITAPKVYSGTEMTNDDNHLFYINDQKKICELQWTSGTGWVGNVVQTTNAVDAADPTVGIFYFDTHVYYASDISSIVCDIVYDASQGTWSGALLSYNPATPKVKHGTKLLTWNKNIHEENQQDANTYFTSHHVFYFDVNDRVNFFIWDDRKCDYRAFGCWDDDDSNNNGTGWDYPPYTSSVIVDVDTINNGDTIHAHSGYDCENCRGVKTWHQGKLNTTSLDADASIAMTNYGEHFYYIGSDNKIHDFLRTPLNGGHDNWNLFWSDEFNGTSLSNDWRKDFHWGNHNSNVCWDVYWNEDANVYVGNGNLTIKAELKDPPVQRFLEVDGIHEWRDYSWLTGMATTEKHYPWYHSDIKFKYGYAEVRCRVPRGKYFWPAFWLTSGPQEDINVFEEDGNGKTLISTAYSTSWHPPVTSYAIGYRYYDDFYVYAVDWDPALVRFYINNEEVGHIVNTTFTDHVIHFTLEMHEVMGMCDVENLPAYFEIDYIRIFENPLYPQRLAINNPVQENAINTIVADQSGNGYVVVDQTDIQYLNVTDISGKIILQSDNKTIPVSNLKSGLYFISVYKTDNTREIIKLVKM